MAVAKQTREASKPSKPTCERDSQYKTQWRPDELSKLDIPQHTPIHIDYHDLV